MKKLLLLITLISSLAFGAEPSTITFEFSDGEPVEFSLFSQEIEALKASKTLRNMFAFTGSGEKPVELPLSRNMFDTILDILSTRVDGQLTFTQDKISDGAQQKILEKLARLNVSELVDLITASEFLEIQTLLKIAGESLVDPKRLNSIISNPIALEALNTVSPEVGVNLIEQLKQYGHSPFSTVFEKTTIPEHEIARAKGPIAVSEDGSLIAFVRPASILSGELFDYIVVYDTHQMKERTFTKISHKDTSMYFSAQGNRLAVASPSELKRTWTVDIWDVPSASKIMTIEYPYSQGLQYTLLSADGDVLYVIFSKKIDAMSIPSGKLKSSFSIESTHSVLLNTYFFKVVNDRYLITFKDNKYYVYDIHTGTLLQTFNIQRQVQLDAVAVSPDGRFFVELTDNTFTIYRVTDGTQMHNFNMDFEISEIPNLRKQRTFAFSPDGSLLAALEVIQNGTNEVLWVWDTTTGSLKLRNHRHIGVSRVGYLPELKFSSSNEFLLQNDDTEPVVYDLEHNVLRRIFKKSNTSGNLASILNNSLNTVINVMENPDRIRYASLIPLYKNLQSIQQLSIQEYVILRALLQNDKITQLPEKALNYLKMTLSPMDKNLTAIVYEYYPQLQPSGNEIQQIQPAQQEEPSLLGRLLRWFIRNQNQ